MNEENMEGWTKEQMDAVFDSKYRVNGKVSYEKIKADLIASGHVPDPMPVSVLWERFLKKKPKDIEKGDGNVDSDYNFT